MSEVAAVAPGKAPSMGTFERYLTLWVALCIVVGIALGQTVPELFHTLGAATVVLETGDHPALLKDAVTTPAGCTIDGILELEEGKLRVTLIKAVVKAAQRAKELAHG